MKEDYKAWVRENREHREDAVRKMAREWVRRFGLDPDAPDFAISLQVAGRQGKPFALILNRCAKFFSPPAPAGFENCLHDQEEIERRLGNPLD